MPLRIIRRDGLGVLYQLKSIGGLPVRLRGHANTRADHHQVVTQGRRVTPNPPADHPSPAPHRSRPPMVGRPWRPSPTVQGHPCPSIADTPELHLQSPMLSTALRLELAYRPRRSHADPRGHARAARHANAHHARCARRPASVRQIDAGYAGRDHRPCTPHGPSQRAGQVPCSGVNSLEFSQRR